MEVPAVEKPTSLEAIILHFHIYTVAQSKSGEVYESNKQLFGIYQMVGKRVIIVGKRTEDREGEVFKSKT